MSKPSWLEAPLRANYLAQDASGEWFWFELEPFPKMGLWQTWGASWVASESTTPSGKWNETLEERQHDL